MKVSRVTLSLVISGLLALPALAQSNADEGGQLQTQIQELQNRLNALNASKQQQRRVTELGASRGVVEPPRIVVRVYDLSDLFSLAPTYPAISSGDMNSPVSPLFPAAGDTEASGVSGMGMGGMGGFGGAGSGLYNVPDEGSPHAMGSSYSPAPPGGMMAARTSIDDLIDAITNTISTDTWQCNGGSNTITTLGNSLLISAPETIHEQVDALLTTLRKRWGTLRTVSVQAHWLWLSEDQLESLLKPEEARARKPDDVKAFGLVDDAAWLALQKKIRDPEAGLPSGWQAAITCYNGQTVHVYAGGRKQIIQTLIPVVGDQAAESKSASTGVPSASEQAAALQPRTVGYQPVTSSVQEGAALQITPVVTVGGKYVVLDVHSRVLQLRKDESRRPVEIGPGTGSIVRDLVAAIDRPLVFNHHLETTLRIPVDRRMLVGGMTFSGQPEVGEPSLFLFVKVAVQELRDDQQEGKPAAVETKSDEPDAATKSAIPKTSRKSKSKEAGQL